MKHVGIICGGYSSEYDVSVKSAKNIYANFPDFVTPHLIFLKEDGWFYETKEGLVSFDPMAFKIDGVRLDAALIYIHGDPGENGKIQAFLDMIGMPYINSGPLASELSFDKWFCNQFLKGFGYYVAHSIYLDDASKTINEHEVIEELGLPIFVKPCDSGSSYGIARVNTKDELIPAINAAFEEGDTVVLEAFLDGVEVTCGVYRDGDEVKALPLAEIVSENEFFDFDAKYNGLSEEIVPARIAHKVAHVVKEQSIAIYKLLKLRSIARIDFMLVDNVPYIIEVNTTPGFSNESIVPKMIAAEGISTAEFWGDILKTEMA